MPTERDLIRDDLLGVFLKVREHRGDVEIVSESPGKTVRCRAETDGSDEYLTLVELEAPNVTPAHFKKLFTNLCQECPFLT